MAKQKTIVDASVIVKWFLVEEGSNAALKIRDDHIAGRNLLIIPELTFIEVLNALRYKGGTGESLAEANQALWDMQFHVEKMNCFILDKASFLALEHNLSIYDAIYLAIGLLYGSPVITADRALAKASNVLLLSGI